jgi:hypothetical protein
MAVRTEILNFYAKSLNSPCCERGLTPEKMQQCAPSVAVRESIEI